MLIFYLLTLFAALPIFAYLLSRKPLTKALFFAHCIRINCCLILFISKFAILGTVQKQTLSEQINNQIYIDENIVKKSKQLIRQMIVKRKLGYRVYI